MNRARIVITVAVGVVLVCSAASAQDISRYRVYVLESSLETVSAAGAGRPVNVKTLHERPARIQELEWRAPYVGAGSAPVDPVRSIAFTFYDDALYQIVVSYDRDRTGGLTNADLIDSVSAVYGATTHRPTRNETAGYTDHAILAQWTTAAATATLLRGRYSPDVQLILVSTALQARARAAIGEALRLDALEAPRREAELRKKEVADANVARDKARTANKAAFRP